MNWTTYANIQSAQPLEKKIDRLMSAGTLTIKQQKLLANLMRLSGNYTEEEIQYAMDYTK